MSEGGIGAVGAAPVPTFGAKRRAAMFAWAIYGIAASIAVLALLELTITFSAPARIFVSTLWWSILAFVTTALLIDRWAHAPTAEGAIWTLFSAAASFAALLGWFGATHSTYSRVALLLAFVVVTIWLALGARRHMRQQVLRLGVPEAAVLEMLAAARSSPNGTRVTHVDAELRECLDLADVSTLDGVVIDRHSEKSDALQRLLTQLKLRGIRIYSADHVHELLTGRLGLLHTEDSFLDDSTGHIVYAAIKRTADVAGSVLLLFLLALPMSLIGAIIRATTGEAALFYQQRVGRGGKPFSMVKFRTMHGAASSIAGSPEEFEERARITGFGRWLRRYRLDELPQLLNVLAGSMSIIGPRPEWTETAATFFEKIPHYPYRHLIRPGITGWAQVSQGHVTALQDAMIKLEFDLYYVKHMSFALDLVITVRTLRTIMSGHGSN